MEVVEKEIRPNSRGNGYILLTSTHSSNALTPPIAIQAHL